MTETFLTPQVSWSDQVSPASNTSIPIPTPPSTAETLMQFELNRQAKKVLDLPEAPYGEIPMKRRLNNPLFKLHLETPHDAALRLPGTLVFFGSIPYYVRQVYQYSKDFILLVEDHDRTRYHLRYSDPRLDLRCPDPQYVIYNRMPVFMARRPFRQQRQGISYENTLMRAVGRTDIWRPDDIYQVISSFRNVNDIAWSPEYANIMKNAGVVQSLRLSPTVAFYLKNKEIWAEYKGRPLGIVLDDEIRADEADVSRPWIRNDIRSTGCKLREK